MKRVVTNNTIIAARRLKETNPILAPLAVRTTREMGLVSRFAAKKPFLSAKMMAKRLFAKKYRTWSVDKLKKVMFSDESNLRFKEPTFQQACQGEAAGRLRQVRGQVHCQDCETPRESHGVGVFQLARAWWPLLPPQGAMMNNECYLETLGSHLIPFMVRHRTTHFLQDGAPCHTAKIVTAFLAKKPLNVLNWPGNSPDLNPIENCWSWMKDQLEDRPTPNLAALINEIKLLWCRGITDDYFQILVKSMPDRLATVIP
jgi:hypothetical protein